MGFRRLRRVVLVAVKAIIACHCQRAAPTLATLFEIAALTAPLIKLPHDAQTPTQSPSSSSTQLGPAQPDASSSSGTASSSTGQHSWRRRPGLVHAVLHSSLLLLPLRAARGWAPAVVLAQGVRLVGSLVQKTEGPHEEPRQEGTEVRALQLGLSAVPRVDPRVPRSLEQYSQIYREWLLLLRGRLAQSCVELPEGLFDEGQEGDEELMRFALCYNLLQARSLKDALVAMDRTLSNIREFAGWYNKYSFIAPADLEVWQRIAWWEGPDSDGFLWLMIDGKAAVEACRTHGPDLVARVLVSNMEYGVRHLIPELECAATLRVVVDASGVNIASALRSRGVFGRAGHVIDRMYPCRLHVLYMVGLPFPLRWANRACMQLLHQHTRRKIRMCRATDVPRRLPSQLRSHKLSVGAGMDAWAFAETQSYYGDGGDGGGPGGFFEGPQFFGADSAAAAAAAAAAALDGGGSVAAGGGSVVGSDLGGDGAAPFTPRTPKSVLQSRAGSRRFRWRRGTRGSVGGREGALGLGGSSRQRLRVRLLRQGAVLLCGVVLLLLLAHVVLRWRGLAPSMGAPLIASLADAVQAGLLGGSDHHASL